MFIMKNSHIKVKIISGWVFTKVVKSGLTNRLTDPQSGKSPSTEADRGFKRALKYYHTEHNLENNPVFQIPRIEPLSGRLIY